MSAPVLLPGQRVAFTGVSVWLSPHRDGPGYRVHGEPGHMVVAGQPCLIVASCIIGDRVNLRRVLILSLGGGLGWATFGYGDVDWVTLL